MRSKTTLWVLALIAAGALHAPSRADAEFQGVLKIPSPGGSGQNIEVALVSYSQIVDGQACFQGVVVKNLDRVSLQMAVLAATKQRLAVATVILTEEGVSTPIEFRAELEDVLVGSVELVEVDGGPTPTERVTLLPSQATLIHTSFPFGGGAGGVDYYNTLLSA